MSEVFEYEHGSFKLHYVSDATERGSTTEILLLECDSQRILASRYTNFIDLRELAPSSFMVDFLRVAREALANHGHLLEDEDGLDTSKATAT